MERRKYQKLNDYVMTVLYSPFMLLIAFIESREAHRVSGNRARGEQDDDAIEEWEEMQGDDILGGGWSEKVEKTVPNIEENPAILEIKDLRSHLDEVTSSLRRRNVGESSDDSS